nr:halocyanin domain-containing protein [Haloarcula sp. S1CR25-12]
MQTEEPTPTVTEESVPPETEGRPAVDAHLAETDNYDGTIVDARGRERTTVRVGVEGNGGRFGFGPPAVHVDSGTTVEWEWTGDGSGHIVRSVGDGPLDSGDALAEPGVNYEFTFEDDGVYNYYCDPHQGVDMKGSIVVGTEYPTTERTDSRY